MTSEKEFDSGDTASTGVGVTVQIDQEAERKVLSKFDWFVMPQMSILVLFAYLDRTNIGMYKPARCVWLVLMYSRKCARFRV